eukprot:2501633-Pleurochrysis_carterae.AAC.1
MWTLLDSRAAGGAEHQQADSSVEQADEPSRRGWTTRVAKLCVAAPVESSLSSSMRASELNLVTHAGYTDADARRAALAEDAETYLKDKFE